MPDFRELSSEEELKEAFPLIKELHSSHTEYSMEDYFEQLDEMMDEGYRLFGLYETEELVSVAGFDISTDFSYGRHIFLHDFITEPDRRGEGYGSRLLEHLEDWAADKGLENIVLPSAKHREKAHQFYKDKHNYDERCFFFRKKL